jgi:hypothetical protein
MRCTGCRRDIHAGADDARGAGGTMLGCAEMTEKVVMLELRCEKEESVERYADERPTIS